MTRELAKPLDQDSVWSFVTGADERQLRAMERLTGYTLSVAAAAGGSARVQGSFHRALSIGSDDELASQHELVANAVHQIVRDHWEVETLSFHAGATVPTYQRLEWLD